MENNKIKEKLDTVRIDREEIRNLYLEKQGYGYDSLCLRYNAARDAQAEWEIYRQHKDPEIAWRMAKKDKIRFYEILDDLIGEHK